MSLQSGSTLYITSKQLRVVENPFWGNMPFIQEGRKSWIYQLIDDRSLNKFALKIFKPLYRDASVKINFDQIKKYQSVIGFSVCNRYLVTKQNEKEIIEIYPELDGAIVMPWVEEYLWSAIVGQKMVLSRETCTLLAEQVSASLVILENNNHAHCDLAGENLVINLNQKIAELLDVEDMFGVDFAKPMYIPMGGDGYHHKTGAQGTWNQFGDRFAGAVLLSELMTWNFKEIREAAYGESFFNSEDMQDYNSPRYRLMVDKLGSLNSLLAELFERAWYSSSLQECPKLSEWHNAINFFKDKGNQAKKNGNMNIYIQGNVTESNIVVGNENKVNNQIPTNKKKHRNNRRI